MGQKRSILVVDDDVDASQMAKMILENTGLYAVRTCNRGSEALKIIRETKPELVLLDIMMPDADGTEIAGQIRNDKSLASTRIAFMTSLVSQEEVGAGSVIGGYPYISKPISGEKLLQQIKDIFKIGS